MPLDFVDIDHIVVRVDTLARAGETFERLGFTPTPVRVQVPQDSWTDATDSGRSSASKATVNQRHVLFRPHPGRDDVGNYIAMIAIEDPLGTPPEVTQMLSYLADTQGPRAMVLKTDDVAAARDALRADGFVTYEPVRFDTGWQDAERDVFVPVSSSACLPIHGQVPFMFDPYQTWTLESSTYAPWVEHRNSARRIVALNGITHDVVRDAEIMATRVFGTDVEWRSKDLAVLRRRDVELRIMSPAGFDDLYPDHDYSTERLLPHLFGMTFAVDSLDRLRTVLDGNGVEHGVGRDGVVVPRHEAHNTLLEFVPDPA